jgi:hypothetical protein
VKQILNCKLATFKQGKLSIKKRTNTLPQPPTVAKTNNSTYEKKMPENIIASKQTAAAAAINEPKLPVTI